MTFKQIKINLEHFQLPGRKNATQRKPASDSDRIEEREKKQREKQEDKTRKQLIRMIEQRQAANMKGLQKHAAATATATSPKTHGPLADAFEYLGVVNQTVHRPPNTPSNGQSSSQQHQHTLKHYHEPEIHTEWPTELVDVAPSMAPPSAESAVHLKPAAPPVYGVLKGGTLPTYRQWIATQRGSLVPTQVVPTQVVPTQVVPTQVVPTQVVPTQVVPTQVVPTQVVPTQVFVPPRPTPVPAAAPKPVFKRAKKMVRRTYKVGRPPEHPQVAVLLSNRTIRRHTLDELERCRETPIQEVKAYLIRHGLIKRSTIAPNKVLRKMYETSKMVCGDVYNKNADVLLYNFLHGT